MPFAWSREVTRSGFLVALAVYLTVPCLAQPTPGPKTALPPRLVELLRQVKNFGDYNCTFIVAIDASGSMDVLFGEAKNIVGALFEAYAVGGDAAYVFTYCSTATPAPNWLAPIPIKGGADARSPLATVAKINLRITELPASQERGTDNAAALGHALELVEREAIRNALILILTDDKQEIARGIKDSRIDRLGVTRYGKIPLRDDLKLLCYARFPDTAPSLKVVPVTSRASTPAAARSPREQIAEARFPGITTPSPVPPTPEGTPAVTSSGTGEPATPLPPTPEGGGGGGGILPFLVALAGIGGLGAALAMLGLRPVPVTIASAGGERTFHVGPHRPLSLGGAQDPDAPPGLADNHFDLPPLTQRVAMITHAFPGRLTISAISLKGLHVRLSDGTEVNSSPATLRDSALVEYTDAWGSVASLEIHRGAAPSDPDQRPGDSDDGDWGFPNV